MEKRSPKILDYDTESDFPSLDPSERRKNGHNSKAVHPPVSRKIALKSEPVPTTEVCSSSRSERNSSSKVLKPCHHKETYSINVSEAIAKTTHNQTAIKNKPVDVKSSVRDERLSGNPLDADNPLRRRGKVGVPKKPKRVSKTKRNVLQVREDISKAKELTKNVVIEAKSILHDSELEVEDLRKALMTAKLAEIRRTLKCLNEVSEGQETVETNQGERNEEKYLNVTDFRKFLESSSIPAHLLLIHNHNFKRYCDNCISSALNEKVTALISHIVRFQQNKYQKNPVKAVANKRFVLGFKQAIKYTKMNKTKLIICVPDMEDSMSELVEELKSLATVYNIPYLFALTRRNLGALTYNKVGICCFAILDYTSAEENFNRAIEEASIAKQTYLEKCSSARERCQLNLGITWVKEIKENHLSFIESRGGKSRSIQKGLRVNKEENDKK